MVTLTSCFHGPVADTLKNNFGNCRFFYCHAYADRCTVSLMAKDFTTDDLHQELWQRVNASNQRSVAASLGVSVAMLNDVLHGRRGVTERIALALGYRREIVFRKSAA